jgi:hypothetical protein
MEIWPIFEGADILAYNALGFHVVVLAKEFARIAASSISSAAANSPEDDCDFQVISMQCSAACTSEF